MIRWHFMPDLFLCITYLQTECIERYQFQQCSKYDREHDFDVILEQNVPCRKLMWICRKHSNDVARQVEIPGKSTIFVARQTVEENASHIEGTFKLLLKPLTRCKNLKEILSK